MFVLAMLSIWVTLIETVMIRDHHHWAPRSSGWHSRSTSWNYHNPGNSGLSAVDEQAVIIILPASASIFGLGDRDVYYEMRISEFFRVTYSRLSNVVASWHPTETFLWRSTLVGVVICVMSEKWACEDLPTWKGYRFGGSDLLPSSSEFRCAQRSPALFRIRVSRSLLGRWKQVALIRAFLLPLNERWSGMCKLF